MCDHPRRGKYGNVLVASFSLSVCLSVGITITFERLDSKFIFGLRSAFRGYGSSSYIKVIRSRSRSQERNSVYDPSTVHFSHSKYNVTNLPARRYRCAALHADC